MPGMSASRRTSARVPIAVSHQKCQLVTPWHGLQQEKHRLTLYCFHPNEVEEGEEEGEEGEDEPLSGRPLCHYFTAEESDLAGHSRSRANYVS
ncbi:hypothetical protein HZH66_012500 [Vespula vulgaris]|uniref:Uncharacterized protein n=1 Tax=Vespula vulgaris TaxID=7454 RepID=A0A834JA45_VESVU|nr:hypothetical protein HZH66_012500 [Vespula vulgaris]